MKVLFVDDEPRVLEAIQRMLFDAAGTWEVETAVSGVEALEKLGSAAFDVIVTDMRMPGMDGAALLNEVQERYPSMTRIVLSGQTEQEHAFRALGTAHQFLSKPCSPKMLTEVVENAFYLRALTPNRRVAELASAVQRLPAMPRVHTKILQLLTSPDASLRDAADLVAQDPGLTAKVLRIVNSAFFARGQIVRDVRTATARLGLDLLHALVLTERAATGIPVAKLEKMHRSALDAAALACRMVKPEDQRTAFTAALLCDIGALVLEQGAPDEVTAVKEHAEEFMVPIHVAEKELLGSSHADVGGYVLGLWGVPPVIVDAVLGHHELPKTAAAITAAVYIAHQIVGGDVVDPGAEKRLDLVVNLDALREQHHAEKSAA
jgi:HD-like signal output (HDOD) protein